MRTKRIKQLTPEEFDAWDYLYEKASDRERFLMDMVRLQRDAIKLLAGSIIEQRKLRGLR